MIAEDCSHAFLCAARYCQCSSLWQLCGRRAVVRGGAAPAPSLRLRKQQRRMISQAIGYDSSPKTGGGSWLCRQKEMPKAFRSESRGPCRARLLGSRERRSRRQPMQRIRRRRDQPHSDSGARHVAGCEHVEVGNRSGNADPTVQIRRRCARTQKRIPARDPGRAFLSRRGNLPPAAVGRRIRAVPGGPGSARRSLPPAATAALPPPAGGARGG